MRPEAEHRAWNRIFPKGSGPRELVAPTGQALYLEVALRVGYCRARGVTIDTRRAFSSYALMAVRVYEWLDGDGREELQGQVLQIARALLEDPPDLQIEQDVCQEARPATRTEKPTEIEQKYDAALKAWQPILRQLQENRRGRALTAEAVEKLADLLVVVYHWLPTSVEQRLHITGDGRDVA